MPKRSHSHELEDASRNRLHEIFTRLGWVVWDLHPDYGEDLLVRVFESGRATHYSFFIQAKATDHIDRYMQRDGKSIRFPIDTDHLEYWSQFWEPVILTVWDATADVTYWEIVQDYLDRNNLGKSWRKHISINIPLTNSLNEEGVKRILECTRTRFKRFELLSEIAQILVKLLEESTGVQIEVGNSSLVIDNPNSDIVEMYALGDFRRELERLATKYNMTPQQFSKVIEDQLTEEYEKSKGSM